jgi:hypothetical protein
MSFQIDRRLRHHLLAIAVFAVSLRMVDAEVVQFNRDIRPILSENCFQCHGPDAKHRDADLRLDLRESAIAKGNHGPVIMPGQSASSELITRITSADDDLKMPPHESGRKLTAEQIELLGRWIEQGAKYEEHWSLIVPQHAALPATKDAAWPRNAIDNFVLARLEREGKRPSPEATKSTWLRRVSFDLTGLPPTVQELDHFLADESPTAYEKVVDRLLASDRYGERMAMHWLDLARYADTNGYNNDEERTQWLWRDWVIDAFNQNMPYDQFVTQQLAGDLLPEATVSQRIATAFNRNHVFTTEGGIIEEEYRVEYVADRVHTTATVFLGLSLQCARCHDHKFDPLSQRDYYRFFAYFNNLDERTVGYNQARVSAPTLQVPSREQQVEQVRLERATKDLNVRREVREASVGDLQQKWEAELANAPATGPGAPLASPLALRLPFDEASGEQVSDDHDPKRTGKLIGQVKWSEGKIGSAIELDGQGYVDLGDAGELEHDKPFSVAAWIFPLSHDPTTVLSKIDEAGAFRGYDLILEQGRPATHIVHRWPEDGLKVIAHEPVALNAWSHVVMTYDGAGKAGGLKLYINGSEQKLDISNDKFSRSGTIKTDKPFHVGRRSQSAPFRGRIDDVRIYLGKLSTSDVKDIVAGQELFELAEIARLPSAERKAEQIVRLRQYYLRHFDAPYQEILAELTALETRKAELEKLFPVTMVMQEMPQPRAAFVLERGQYDQRGEQVQPGVPASLPPLPENAPPNRLALARWLVEPAHPLTARVAVNRWWQQLFGVGIVETVEDFGSQGAWPTHPELLDYLATEFSGAAKSDGRIRPWDVKSLLKQIALSATYRQSSRVTPQQLEDDPKNRLLARGPRFRLPAETMRDNALAISGLLESRIGGPSVKPYQPDGLWQDVSVERRAVYQQDTGPDLYRRSMYTFWKRTCPPPAMSTFDAPDRETCTVRRARTNTPLQALVLMNDPTYLEASRKLAERTLHDGSENDGERLNHAYRLAVAREPRQAEVKLLLGLLTQARERFQVAPAEAEKLVAIGAAPRDPKLLTSELAAWTTLSSIILSLDEAITKE